MAITNVAQIQSDLNSASQSIAGAVQQAPNMLAQYQQTQSRLNVIGTTYAALIANITANVQAAPTDPWVLSTQSQLNALAAEASAWQTYYNMVNGIMGAMTGTMQNSQAVPAATVQ